MVVLVEYANGDNDVLQVDLMESWPKYGEPTANAPVMGLHLAHGARSGRCTGFPRFASPTILAKSSYSNGKKIEKKRNI
jgi:hypothetical protein